MTGYNIIYVVFIDHLFLLYIIKNIIYILILNIQKKAGNIKNHISKLRNGKYSKGKDWCSLCVVSEVIQGDF